jgi:myo-inositol-1(or 4)-monophosphatase
LGKSERDVAIAIAREAGAIVLSHFGSALTQARQKGIRDVVTSADYVSEDFIRSRLEAQFPDDGIVAEEGGRQAPESSRRWYVDPLDGTFNFTRGIPVFAVSLSLFERDQPIVGVVHDPVRQETFHAAAGGGAWVDERRIAVSRVTNAKDAVVHLTVDFDNVEMQAGLHDLELVAPRVLKTRNVGSAALALAYVAAGRLDAMAHRYAHTWDFGGGAVLVREAGGIITDLRGDAYGEQTTNVLAASSSELHTELLFLIRSPGSSRVE